MPLGLAAIGVRTDDLSPLRAKTDGFTGVTAAQALGVHQDCVRALIRDKTLAKGANGLISEAAVEKFKSDYVVGSELARERGRAPARLIADLAKAGINPVWPLATHRQAIFRRADLLRRAWTQH